MAETIYYPDATAEDGFIYKSDAVWANARGAATGDVADYASGTGTGPQTSINAGGNYLIYRSFVMFNTTALPANVIISSATISMYVSSKTNDDNDGDDYVVVVSSSPASDNALITADYNQIGSTALSDTIDIGDITTSAYNVWTLNSTGLAQITKAGVSKFAFREGHDMLNNAFVGSNNTKNTVAFDYNEGTNKPKLTITYTIPGGGNPMFFSSGGLSLG